jgi:uncharacterized protein YcbK (DUF882 family)
VVATRGTQDAVANGDTRTITIQHEHTKELATITFRRDGRYDSQGLEQLNWLLRDWRHDEPTKMDPRLFDIVWQVTREVGAREPIRVVSAYRSPQTNAMLRRRSRAVAKHSQHMQGKAMDFYLTDVGMDRVRAIAMRLQHGGVGYYPTAYNPFVHLDAGSVRSWPRMTRDQLARLFPDGRTVHIPADGKPLEGYEEARAEIVARGGSVAGYAAYAEAEEAGGSGGRRKSFWATLFGSGDDEDSDYYATPAASARARPAASPPSTSLASAYLPSANSEDAGTRGYFAFNQPPPEPAASRTRGRAAAPAAPPQPAQQSPVQVAAASEPEPAAPVRVASLAGPDPRLAWQAGPAGRGAIAGQAEPDDEGAAKTLAIVPLPPRRPGDELFAGTLVFAPLPPSRPVELASLGTPTLPAARVPDAPPSARAVVEPAPKAGPADEGRLQLRALFAAVAQETTPARKAPVATTKAKAIPAETAGHVANEATGVRMSFTTKAPDELPSSRFTGPAVKPLPVLR